MAANRWPERSPTLVAFHFQFNFTTHSVNHKLNVTVGLLHHRGFDCFTAVGVFLKSVCFCSRSVFKCVTVSFKEPFSRRSCFKE